MQFKHEYCGWQYIDLIQFQYFMIQEELTGMCKIICIRQNSNCSFLESYYAIQFKCICVTLYHVTVVDIWKNICKRYIYIYITPFNFNSFFNHYAPVSQANWSNMTFTAGNLFPSHSCIGWSESSLHWDLNPCPEIESLPRLRLDVYKVRLLTCWIVFRYHIQFQHLSKNQNELYSTNFHI